MEKEGDQGRAMGRIKQLGREQKVILCLMVIMIVVFTILYSITIAREGFLYEDAILIPKQENGVITYSGKIEGEPAVFTVSEDKSITFQYGDKVYGPYIIKEDETAIPNDSALIEGVIGIEIYQGKEVIFRGSARKMTDYWMLENEDGSANINFFATQSDGTVIDGNGNVVDPMEPSVSTILELANGPELTHKGHWFVWFLAVFYCCFVAVRLIFADEIFRLKLAFQVRNVESVEPSDWEMTGRHVAWFVGPIIAMILFIVGLK